MRSGFDTVVADQFPPREGWKNFSALFGLEEMNPDGDLARLAVNLQVDMWQVEVEPDTGKDEFDARYPDKDHELVKRRWQIFKAIYSGVGFALDNPHVVRTDTPPIRIGDIEYSVGPPAKGWNSPVREIYDWAVYKSCSVQLEAIASDKGLSQAHREDLEKLALETFSLYDADDGNFQDTLLRLVRPSY